MIHIQIQRIQQATIMFCFLALLLFLLKSILLSYIQLLPQSLCWLGTVTIPSDPQHKPYIHNSLFSPEGNTIISDLDYKHEIDKQYNALFSGWDASIVFPAYVNEVYDLP